MEITMQEPAGKVEVSLNSLNKQVGKLFEMQRETALVVEKISEERRGLFDTRHDHQAY